MLLKAGKLYILSGRPGSGKSTFLRENVKAGAIQEEMIVSSDKIRETLVGTLFKISIKNKVATRLSEQSNDTVFHIVETVLKEKFKEKLTVFLDATNISDKERSKYVNLANKYGVESEVLIFNTSLEECIKNNQKRDRSLEQYVLEKFDLQEDSIYPHQMITSKTKVSLTPNTILETKFDAVGDIHGLLSLFIESIESLGYVLEKGIPVHPKGRKLLFLGDFIDRGPESIECLNFVYEAVKAGHYAVIGNHENKFIRNYELFKDGKELKGSVAVLSTFLDGMKKFPKKMDEFYIFLKSLPGYYVWKNYVFCHADISYFSFKNTPLSEYIYGSYPQRNTDTDKEYQDLFKKGKNQYILIRGHLSQKSIQKFVFSLEEGQAYEGNLVILPMDKLDFDKKTMSVKKSFDKNVKRFKSSFNYDVALKQNKLFVLNKLVETKLATEKVSPDGLLKMYKYSKSVFYKNLWNDGGDALLKARGLVTDVAGRIVQHSFDKIFNYKENGAGLELQDSDEVQYIEKMNGFLGNITLNPFTKELLITTTGSFDSDFVGYIKSLIKNEWVFKKFFFENNLTLSFEVIHKDDPHIIEYSEEEYGLYLIGARGKAWDAPQLSEELLDAIGEELKIKRPKHGKKTFKEIKEDVKTSKLEGYMIRKDDKHIIKFKTPFYLTTKFIGRMSEGNISFMFNNPEKFKEKLDEEFFELVDIIVNKVNKEAFIQMDNVERIAFVRELIVENL